MKKLTFNFNALEGAAVLTRDQLKMVIGGDDGSGAAKCNAECSGSCTLSAPCEGQTGTCKKSETLNKCFCQGGC